MCIGKTFLNLPGSRNKVSRKIWRPWSTSSFCIGAKPRQDANDDFSSGPVTLLYHHWDQQVMAWWVETLDECSRKNVCQRSPCDRGASESGKHPETCRLGSWLGVAQEGGKRPATSECGAHLDCHPVQLEAQGHSPFQHLGAPAPFGTRRTNTAQGWILLAFHRWNWIQTGHQGSCLASTPSLACACAALYNTLQIVTQQTTAVSRFQICLLYNQPV